MLAQIESMILLCHRVSTLAQKGKATMGMIAMTKAHCTKTAREIAAISREVMGGNGILYDNHAMMSLIDIEGVYTYEGSYEINSLVAGRELTGLSAFR